MKEDIHYAPNADFLSKRSNVTIPQALRAGRIPPQAIDMEQAVLGAVLLERDAMDRVAGVLSGEMFYKEANRLIFEACMVLYSTSRAIDMLTVKNQLGSSGMLENAGGFYYLTELTSKIASSANIEDHAAVIHDKWVRRKLIIMCDEASSSAYDETSKTFEVHSGLMKNLEDLEPKSNELVNGIDFIPQIANDVEAAMRGESPSIRLGFKEMDGEYAFDFGEYAVVAGDSGTGKTTFIMQVAKRIRRDYPDVPILFNARDMEGKKVVARDMASEMGMSQMRFRTGNGIEKRHFADMNELACAYDGIYFCSEFTAGALRAHVRKLKKDLGLTQNAGIVVINDYLQLADSEGSSREQQVANSSLDDKKIAIRNRALVIDLSQVNESAGKMRPNHKSIRESRAPYHHADWVIFLYSPSKNGEEMYEDASSTKNIIEAIFDKVRCGRPGNIVKLWMNEHGLITDMPDTMFGGEPDELKPLPKIQPKDYSIPKREQVQEEDETGDQFPF